MYNIYDIFEDEQENLFDKEYNEIQESLEIKILDSPVENMLERLIYNNPEKKKLSVLIEEAEAAETNSVYKIIEKLKQQMQRVLNWIMNMFKHYDKLFQEGANFVKNNNLNQHMNTIKANHIDVDVTWHSKRPPFQRMRTECLKELNSDKWIMRLDSFDNQATTTMKASEKMADNANSHLAAGDKTESYLNSLIKFFKMDKENLTETKLVNVNVLVVHNNLSMLPEANRKLNQIKSKIQRVYNNAINRVRSDANTTKEKKALKANNHLTSINAHMKSINERIRAYAKIMAMVFNEDYNLAKLIVSKSTGKTVTGSNDKTDNKKKVIPFKKKK